MNDINKQFEIINEILDRIDAKQKEINDKLDELIAALHAYDDENIEDVNEGYGESSFESFMDSKNDILSWDVDGAERRIHHVTNKEADEDAATFNDYGMRVVKDKDNNTQDKRTVREKDKHVGKKKRDKWVSPYPPNPKRKFTQDLIPKNKG
jgi:hypothetical protein